jgi:hypothetical protein
MTVPNINDIRIDLKQKRSDGINTPEPSINLNESRKKPSRINVPNSPILQQPVQHRRKIYVSDALQEFSLDFFDESPILALIILPLIVLIILHLIPIVIVSGVGSGFSYSFTAFLSEYEVLYEYILRNPWDSIAPIVIPIMTSSAGLYYLAKLSARIDSGFWSDDLSFDYKVWLVMAAIFIIFLIIPLLRFYFY